ncbi:hypothetical protein F5B21DRAFT_492277 [Xylaria acuta]|nr:hypothetical protein F5B21DRAFT_492277 [Xylaria acuta]
MRVALSLTTITLSCVVLAGDHSDSPYGLGMMTFTSDNFCGNSSFEHETSAELPFVADCQKLVDHLKSDGKYGYQFIGWDKDHLDSPYLELGIMKTCAFGAKPLDTNDGPPVVTQGDAADVIQDAITKLSTNNQVRGSGVMDCQVTDDNARVLSWKGNWGKRKFSWQLYKPGSVPIIQF